MKSLFSKVMMPGGQLRFPLFLGLVFIFVMPLTLTLLFGSTEVFENLFYFYLFGSMSVGMFFGCNLFYRDREYLPAFFSALVFSISLVLFFVSVHETWKSIF